MRELRNQGGHVLDRVAGGERVTITRDGRPVARLEPIGREPLTTAALIDRFRALPPMDPQRLRDDMDSIVDQSL